MRMRMASDLSFRSVGVCSSVVQFRQGCWQFRKLGVVERARSLRSRALDAQLALDRGRLRQLVEVNAVLEESTDEKHALTSGRGRTYETIAPDLNVVGLHVTDVDQSPSTEKRREVGQFVFPLPNRRAANRVGGFFRHERDD